MARIGSGTKGIKKGWIMCAFLCLLLPFEIYAGKTRVDGTDFSDTVAVGKNQLYLKGAALLRYLLFIDAYAGALYLPRSIDGSRALEDVPKYLVLEYRVAISGDDFAEATREKIKESVSENVFRRLDPKIEQLNSWYQSVTPKDRYALAYVPGAGTQLLLNSVPLGTIPGAEFARALFGIWIGENPIDKGFRDRLLGKIK